MSILRKVISPLNPPEKSGQALKGTFANCSLISTPAPQADREVITLRNGLNKLEFIKAD